MQIKHSLKKTKVILFSLFILITFECMLILTAPFINSLSNYIAFENTKVKLILSVFQLLFIYLFLFYIFKINTIKEKNDSRKKTKKIYFDILIFILGYLLSYFTYVFFDIFGNIPISEAEIIFSKTIEKYPWYGIIMALIIAPICEELLFRYFILNHLCTALKPRYAIISSALLFGAFHLNIRQFILASVLGLFLAYIYDRTKNLKYSILLHFAYNSASFIPILYFINPIFNLISLIICIVILFIILEEKDVSQ